MNRTSTVSLLAARPIFIDEKVLTIIPTTLGVIPVAVQHPQASGETVPVEDVIP